jgi:hypothetical protein
VWLDRVARAEPGRLEITWKSFVLDQINSKKGSDWKLWEQDGAYEDSRSLLSLHAGESAKLQGRDAFERFHVALLVARHGGRRLSLTDRDALVGVAREVGLDVPRFEQGLDDRGLLENIARDHKEAVEQHGVFGTPTFLFENGTSAYLKSFVPPEDDSVDFFNHFVALFADRAYVGEIKRPQPPWPKGAV